MTTLTRTNSMTHYRVVVTRHGGPEVLQLLEEDLPQPRAGEVRVKVLAAGVSAYDLMHRSSGLLLGAPRMPFTLGEDIVGVVYKLGEAVSTLEMAQMVPVLDETRPRRTSQLPRHWLKVSGPASDPAGEGA